MSNQINGISDVSPADHLRNLADLIESGLISLEIERRHYGQMIRIIATPPAPEIAVPSRPILSQVPAGVPVIPSTAPLFDPVFGDTRCRYEPQGDYSGEQPTIESCRDKFPDPSTRFKDFPTQV